MALDPALADRICKAVDDGFDAQLDYLKTLVRFPGAGERTLPLDAFTDQIPRLRDLAESYPRLWKLYVFCSEEDRALRRHLQEMCLDALPEGCVNALRI